MYDSKREKANAINHLINQKLKTLQCKKIHIG